MEIKIIKKSAITKIRHKPDVVIVYTSDKVYVCDKDTFKNNADTVEFALAVHKAGVL